jgi:hypothetical protein
MSSSAYDSIIAELEHLAPQSGALDAHSHLGSDEDGSSLEPDALLKALDEVSGSASAVVFHRRIPAAVRPTACRMIACWSGAGRAVAG